MCNKSSVERCLGPCEFRGLEHPIPDDLCFMLFGKYQPKRRRMNESDPVFGRTTCPKGVDVRLAKTIIEELRSNPSRSHKGGKPGGQ